MSMFIVVQKTIIKKVFRIEADSLEDALKRPEIYPYDDKIKEIDEVTEKLTCSGSQISWD